MKRVYEVLKHYSVIETYHVLATSEDEAIKQCNMNHFRKSYDDGSYVRISILISIRPHLTKARRTHSKDLFSRGVLRYYHHHFLTHYLQPM